MSKSVVPVLHGFPNPLFERTLALIKQQRELQSLVGEVKYVARARPGKLLSHGEVCEKLRGGRFEERLRAIWDMMHKGKTEPILGPPPRPAELYGRFGVGVSIMDIGSGNCSKLSLFSGDLKVSVCDVLPVKTNLVVKILEGPVENNLNNESTFFTSFMALPQIDPETTSKILERDGLHVVPDYDWLVKEGVAKLRPDGRYDIKTVKQLYVDHYVNGPGYSSKNGYKILAAFSQVTITVDLAREKSKGEVPMVDASPAGVEDINYDDVTYKYDGIPYELELHQGQAYFTNRAGEQYLGETDFAEHLCVHLEQMPEYYVLIRILEYKGMVPPHSGPVLREFANRVVLQINGLPVIGPQPWDPRVNPAFPYDGLISRTCERDTYHKGVWTVDLFGDSIDKLKKHLETRGFKLVVEKVEEGLWEYELFREEAVVTLKPLKHRVDKKKATTFETVLYLLDKKTLSEYEALTGMKWNN